MAARKKKGPTSAQMKRLRASLDRLRSQGVEFRRIDRLEPWDENPKAHSGDDVLDTVASMLRFGWTQPILVREGDGMVVAGHKRLMAAQHLKLEEVPVIELDHEAAEAKLYAVVDNAQVGPWDKIKLPQVLRSFRPEDVRRLAPQLALSLPDDGYRSQSPTPPSEGQFAGEVAAGDGWELRLGRYQDVLVDVDADACITDPPYSPRTHSGQRHGRRVSGGDGRWCSSKGLPYEAWTEQEVAEFLGRWGKTRGWLGIFTDSELYATWRDHLKTLQSPERLVFAPVACMLKGANVRLAGDGPANWTTWFVVSRTKALSKWGALPGGYFGTPGHGTQRAKNPVPGAKPIWLMREIIRDYTRPGDLVVDPCAGGASTLIAAVLEGRRAIGAEADPETHRKAVERLWRHLDPQKLQAGQESPDRAE